MEVDINSNKIVFINKSTNYKKGLHLPGSFKDK